MADETEAARPESAKPDPAGRGGGRPGGSRPLLLLALLGGTAVAAVSLHAGGDLGRTLGPLHGDWFLVVVVVVAGGWFLTAKYHARQNERPLGTAREGRLTTLTYTALVLTVLGTSIAVAMLGMDAHLAPPPPPPPPTPPPVGKVPVPTQQPVAVAPAQAHGGFLFSVQDLLLGMFWLAVAVLLVLAVIAARRFLAARSVPPAVLQGTLETPAEEQALSAAVSAGRLALEGEDVRAAVIACYAAMERSLAESGLGRRASDSPADLLQRAGEAGLLVGLAPQQLAALFREARYSTHPMTGAQLDRARTALDDIGRLLAEYRTAQQRAAADTAAAAATDSATDSATAAAARADATNGAPVR